MVNKLLNSDNQREILEKNIIRKGELKDVKDIARIHTECRKNNYKGIIDDEFLNNIDIKNKTKERKKFFEKGETFYIVKEIHGKVIGFIDGQINSNKEYAYDFEIKGLYVDINYQKLGIGKELFNELINHEKFRNYKSFYLFTLKNNTSSRSFYDKLGGKIYKEINHKIGGKTYKLVCYYRKK